MFGRYFLFSLFVWSLPWMLPQTITGQTDILSETTRQSLASAIRGGSVEQKRDALHLIRASQSPEASRIAIPALGDTDEIVRATAAFAVVFLPKDEAFTVLVGLLSDKKALVRRETAYALGRIQAPSAVPFLLQILSRDREFEVRNAAAVALGEIGDPASVPQLTAILERRPNQEKAGDSFLRRAAARSIGQIAQIIQTGQAEVLTPQSFLPSNYKKLPVTRTKNFFTDHPQFGAATAILKTVLDNPREADDTRREAAFALGAIGDLTAIPVLEKYLAAEDYYLAEIAKESILKLKMQPPL